MHAEKIVTEIRREQIAQAALEVISLYGIKGLTNERVAALVGIVPSALYKHYKNKSKIIEAVVELMRERMMNVIKTAQRLGSDPLECIRRVYLTEIRMIIQSPGAPFILFLDEFITNKNKIRNQFEEIGKLHFEELTKLFQKALDHGQIRRDFSPQTLVVFYMGVVSQTMFLTNPVFLSNPLSDKNAKTDLDILKHSENAWKAFVEMLKAK